MNDGFVGRSMPRLEDARFLTGRGRFIADLPFDGLQAHFVRSPHGHARIVGIDAAAARAMPGVRAVITGAALAADGLGPQPCATAIDAVEPLIVPPRLALPVDRVRHVGDPVACIVADTVAQALDAAEVLQVDYEPLPCIVDPPGAYTPDAPQLWAEAPRNSAFLFRKGDAAAVAAGLQRARHIVDTPIVNNRVVVAPIEPRGAIARYDAAADLMHLDVTGMGVHGMRKQLAEAVFKMPVERMRITVPDVGGGFGVKNFVYPEYVVVLWAARRLGRPVRWISERLEDFVTSIHGRDNVTSARLGLDVEGRFLALDVHTIANLGAYVSAGGPGSATNAPGMSMGGGYVIPAIHMEARGVFTNMPPLDAYRGAGKPEANYIIERLVDRAAAVVGIDAVELRRRNLVASFPYRTAMGLSIDCGRFAANLEDAIRAADRDGFAVRREASLRQGRRRGLGVCCFIETSRGAPTEQARIAFEADGQVLLAVGTHSNGQGHETSYPQIAADMLGLPVGRFRYRQGDTALLPGGNGHGGARSMHMGGQALVLAIDAMLDKARRIAAHLLQAPVESLAFRDGAFVSAGGERRMSLDEIATAAGDRVNLPDGIAPGLDGYAVNPSDLFTVPNGCHVAEVEVDPETGGVRLQRYTLVDDFGRLVNPMLTLGQVHGGVAQGIGQAMLEHVVFDAATGQFVSGSLMDYALPRADDLPSFGGWLSEEAPTDRNRLGVKGSGQAGCMAAPQTIISAILDALRPLGVTHIDMPATPQRVWQAIRDARRS